MSGDFLNARGDSASYFGQGSALSSCSLSLVAMAMQDDGEV